MEAPGNARSEEEAARARCTPPRVRANSRVLHGLGNLIPHPQVGMLITHTWEGGVR